ncbi:diguanylate cyclase (GGDEF) domain-containing protein [Thermus oshimai JL-2]|uniref:Diguanylate cyclase (GGDEF) domain-containing protein n=1 Tax=Thermus oshimai JL-2 TaxID=751945 RepID=K7R152_THEOS|nr:GGDEF domain-containing protein [Thermus oshimai]AFV77050.1 diguanylate cyclase (GGDEF) domain-containing protein [Thermus oshimai JL-2]
MIPIVVPLAALVFLGLFPLTAPLSELWLKPLVALAAGTYLLRFQLWPWSIVLLGLGLGDLSRSLLEMRGGTGHPFPALFYLLGYAALTAAVHHLPGKPPRYALALLPLALGGFYGTVVLTGVERVYAFWNTLLILLFLPKTEWLLETGGLKATLVSVGLLLFLVADWAHALLEAQGGHPLGHPLHLLPTLSYLLWTLGLSPLPLRGFLGPGLVFLGLWSMPAALLGEPGPLGLRLLALYGTLVGGLGFLYANFTARERIAERQKRWGRFLERLNRLNPRVTQTLSPEAFLLEALESARELWPEAVGLEVRARRGLVGERTPHAVPIPMNGDTAFLYFQTPPAEDFPGALALLGERIRQVLRQMEWGAMALQDPLTGLWNRRGLELELPKLLALASRYAAPVSVAFLDIDRFKSVNDAYGHPVGDEVLRRLGAIVQASVRREDLAVRYGGEEFLLVLYGADLEAAREVVERIRARFRGEAIPPIPHPLTLSAGVAGGKVPKSLEELEDWILKADFALLRAKEAGRNRVTFA